MRVPYSVFVNAFTNKITEYELVIIQENFRDEIVHGYMKRSIRAFKNVCEYDLVSTQDDEEKSINIDIADEDIDKIDDIIDIVSEGMIVQWLKPYVYKQDLLENVLNTKDFSQYSPAELLLRVGNVYTKAQNDFTQMIREYSFDYGDLTDLHL